MDMDNDIVLLAHGSGGEMSHELVERLFLRHFDNPILARLDDAAVLPMAGGRSRMANGNREVRGQASSAISYQLLAIGHQRLAFTTDSYVVSPIFFPGGDIGKLAVCGTVNDLAMSGATPLYLSAGFILEEGLPLAELEQVVASMAKTAEGAGVQIVTGDTKVPVGVELGSDRVRPSDVVILSGTLGDHGMTIMSQREGLRFSSPLESDCAPLHGLVAAMLEVAPGAIHCLRDPTRGGLATTLNEVAGKSGVGIEVHEDAIPVRDAVRAACEMLGLDPLYVANEGKLVAFVAPEAAETTLAAMRAHEYGQEATIIGAVKDEHAGRVVLRTTLGARRILDMLVGDQLPRIC